MDGKKQWGVTPLPHYRVRKIYTHAILYDGDTLVLGNPVDEKGQPAEKPGDGKKHLLVFVTATLIDPAGNRVHSDDENPTPNRK